MPYGYDCRNPLLDYRLNVTFSHPASGEEIIVPGYFAADGWATETGGSSGSGWRVHFLPRKTGEWLFDPSFREGAGIALSVAPTDGDPGHCACESYAVVEMIKVGGQLSTMPWND